MYNHAPRDYECPLCSLATGGGNDITSQQDVVFHNSMVTLFISGKWWKNNPGHILIIPNKHFENIYEIDDLYAHEVQSFAKKASLALKEIYRCDGVSIVQQNEPDADQEVFHYHVHVVPRYKNDAFFENFRNTRWANPQERLPYAEKLKDYFTEHNG